ncbi:hypothetical protein BD310DRAFT_808030 [Dichomitus squalens]|uniref:GDP-fucose protein O-fucosyltransferase 2 n=1 Tax=Dichomitus squalens TaxID=114155 RepID=A0A4Q9Q8G2_9APHY|nr:hypothetical protein BD310DRAFT_808030 [Dichomitus squalens]
MSYLPRRRLLGALFSLTVLSFVALSVTTFGRVPEETFQVTPEHGNAPPQQHETNDRRPEVDLTHPPLPPAASEPDRDPVSEEEYSYSPRLVGPPTQSFRDNLRNDTKYITSWPSAGWTNDVMTYANLIYLGSLTERVPIIPMFTPSHIGGDAAPIPFGEVFDVPRFIEESGIEIVEWDEVKDPESNVVDDLGCWNIWEAVQYREHHPRPSAAPDWLKLDLSYTKAPDWVKLIPNYEHDSCSTFMALTRLSYPEERSRNIGHALPSPLHNAVLDPEEHVLCYDYLYYACAQQSYEYDFDYAPMWRYVLRHFHWTQRIELITQQYVREVFELPPGTNMPPFIAVHIRHGDFSNWCWAAENPEDCFAPISAIERRVKEVQDELRERKGLDVDRIFISSDEKDPAWWDQIKALGWRTVDHDAMRTAAVYGRWYPVIIDAAIQSAAVGFVGTDRSTYSIVSRRRVQSWQDGVTRVLKWGFKGADDH